MTMSEETGRPCGMPWVVPYLTVKDVAAALDFYERAFGFTKRNAMPGPDGALWHAEMTWQDGVVMMGAEGAFGGDCRSPATLGIKTPISLFVYCADVDAVFARASAAGATVGMPPADMFWGDRMCHLVDPDGHIWNFATHTGIMSAPPAMPEPATAPA